MKPESGSTRKQSLAALLKNYRPTPGDGFYRRMEKSPWRQKDMSMTPPSRHTARWIWQTGLALCLVLIILTLSIPPARAALSAWLGLSVAPSNRMPSTTVNLVGIVTSSPTTQPLATNRTASITSTPLAAGDTGAPPAASTPVERITPSLTQPAANPAQPAEISQLSSQAGWDVLSPARLPQDYKFGSAYFDTNHKMVILTYMATRALPGASDPSLTETKSITFLQAMTHDFIPMQVAPSSKVTDVQVSGAAAAYTVGAWDSEFVPDPKDPKSGQMVSTWRNDLDIQNLYWQAGKIYLLLVCDDPAVSQAALIDMAESVAK